MFFLCGEVFGHIEMLLYDVDEMIYIIIKHHLKRATYALYRLGRDTWITQVACRGVSY